MRRRWLLSTILTIQLAVGALLVASPRAFSDCELWDVENSPCLCPNFFYCTHETLCDPPGCWISSEDLCQYGVGECECCEPGQLPPDCDTDFWMVFCNKGWCAPIQQ
jgi:hypothetical protein